MSFITLGGWYLGFLRYVTLNVSHSRKQLQIVGHS